MATDLAKVWDAATTGMADRKELLRFLVHRVYLDGVTEPGQVRSDHGVAHGGSDDADGAATGRGGLGPEDRGAVVDRIRELLPTLEYEEIAARLNEEGFRTAKGLRFNFYSVGYIARSRGCGGPEGRNSGPMYNPCAL